MLNIIGVTAVEGIPHYIDSSRPHVPSDDTGMQENDYSDDGDDGDDGDVRNSNDDDKYFELLHI